MPVPTKPWQPVIYDSMLLVDAAVALQRFGAIDRKGPQFCDREKNLVVALTRIRNLAQFLSATGDPDLIKVTDGEFRGTAEKRFMKGTFHRISMYVSHLHEQRYKKGSKYKRPNGPEACKAAEELLPVVHAVLERIRSKFRGDARHWYSVFAQRMGDFERTCGRKLL